MSQKTDTGGRDVDIALLRKGDRAAFAHFVEAYRDMVFACCRATGLDKDDSDDVAAETFLAAWQSFHRFNGDCKLSSWLWAIAYRKALTLRSRKQSGYIPVGEAQKTIAMQEQYSGHMLETQEQTDLVWQAVQQLPQSLAAAIVLFYREDKSVAEISNILDIPVNTVKTHLDRGRKKLYELLNQYWEKDYVKS